MATHACRQYHDASRCATLLPAWHVSSACTALHAVAGASYCELLLNVHRLSRHHRLSCSQARLQQLGLTQVGRTLRVGGWVKTGRTAGGGDFAFLELNDGSTFANLQVL